MVGSVGSGGSNVAEVLGLMAQQSQQDPVSMAASMDVLKAALNQAQTESAALIAQVNATGSSGSLDVYA